MIIPAEAAAPYARESMRFVEERKARPVDGLSAMHEDLPGSLPQQSRDTADHHLASPQRGYDEAERRQGDRRQASTPMMLDTRATRSRRQATLPSPINVRI
jgi:hypothetical protein